MGGHEREIRAALAKAGVSNITSMTGENGVWRVVCGPGTLHVRTGWLNGGSAWSVLAALTRVRQPYLAPVVGSLELSGGEVAVVSRPDDGRALTDVINWGRRLSVGESVSVLSAMARAAAALRGAVGHVGGVNAGRCQVLASGRAQLMDPAAGLLCAEDDSAHTRSLGDRQEARGHAEGRDTIHQLCELASELGQPRLAAVMSEHAPAGCGAVARALEDSHAPEPVVITNVPRLPGPRATRQHRRATAEPQPPATALPSAPPGARW